MIKQITEEAKIRAFSPKYAKGMLYHSFGTTTPDEDGSDLSIMVMPLGFVVEWMKIIQKEAIADERARIRENLPKIITLTVESPFNNLSQNQIFVGGQINMLLRVTDLLASLDKPLTKKE